MRWDLPWSVELARRGTNLQWRQAFGILDGQYREIVLRDCVERLLGNAEVFDHQSTGMCVSQSLSEISW